MKSFANPEPEVTGIVVYICNTLYFKRSSNVYIVIKNDNNR